MINSLEIGHAPSLHVAVSGYRDPLPVLLVHGYSSNHADWALNGLTQALENAGRGWIAPDLRGHGKSGKPHDPIQYRVATLVEDLVLALDAVQVERADVVGYSLGGELALEFALAHPDRVRRLVVGGIGDRRPHTADDTAKLLEHVVAGSEPPDDQATRLWSRASAKPGSDPVALAACLAGVSGSPPLRALDRYRGPTLLFAGTDDDIAGGIESLQEPLSAELLWLEGCDHRAAMSSPLAQEQIVAFLGSADR